MRPNRRSLCNPNLAWLMLWRLKQDIYNYRPIIFSLNLICLKYAKNDENLDFFIRLYWGREGAAIQNYFYKKIHSESHKNNPVKTKQFLLFYIIHKKKPEKKPSKKNSSQKFLHKESKKNSKQFLKKFLILKISNSLHLTWRPKTLSGLLVVPKNTAD